MTDQPPKSKRRWFQFSLRTLLIAVTLAAGLLVAWRVYVEPFRQQRETMKIIKALGGVYETEPGGPRWLRGLFGDENFQNIIVVDLSRGVVAPFIPPNGRVTFAGYPGFFQAPPPREEDLAAIFSLEKLAVLRLRGIELSADSLRTLQQATQIEELDLSACAVTDELVRSLSTMASIRVLHLSVTKITDRSFRNLALMTNLEELHVDGCNVSATGFRAFVGHSALRFIYARGAHLTKEDAAKAIRVLPKTEIYIDEPGQEGGIY